MLSYEDKVILAPMVRVGTLPVRLLCLQYGADIVYSEEIVDHKLLAAVRYVNERLGTIDYIDPADGIVVLRTCSAEKHALVLQMGTSDPQRAAQVAQKYERDVAAIDVNMGCPKEFSIKGGMGAALLESADKASDIVTALVNAVDIPVTCKIRVLSGGLDATVRFCKILQRCGVAAIAVHGRRRHERPRHANDNRLIGDVAAVLRVPVIANGGSLHIRCRCDIEKFRVSCGEHVSSVMVARAAMWNMSVFGSCSAASAAACSASVQPLDKVIRQLLRLCIRYDHPFTLVKYTIQQMLRELQETPRGKLFLQAQTLEQICDLWSLGDECRSVLGPAELVTSYSQCGDVIPSKRPALESDVIAGKYQFIRGNYNERTMPKTVLHNWCRSRGGDDNMPIYTVQFADKLFRAICLYDGKKFASAWEKNIKFAEQGAALSCLVWLRESGCCVDADTNGTTESASF